MYDLHTHTLLGDGELLPSELIARASHLGLKGIAITEHADPSNLEFLMGSLLKLGTQHQIPVLIGVELTHVAPDSIPKLVQRARSLGAQLVCIHGESLWEPVAQGTNAAGIQAGADIIFHPGLITPELCELARDHNVKLEITAKRGHCLGNGHLAKLSSKLNLQLVFGSDAHSPEELCSPELIRRIVLGAGLDEPGYRNLVRSCEKLIYEKLP